MITIQIVKGNSGQWHGNIIATNGKITYSQEPVHNLQDAIDTARELRDNGLLCKIEVYTNEATIPVA